MNPQVAQDNTRIANRDGANETLGNHNWRPQRQVISRATGIRRLGRGADSDRIGPQEMTVVLSAASAVASGDALKSFGRFHRTERVESQRILRRRRYLLKANGVFWGRSRVGNEHRHDCMCYVYRITLGAVRGELPWLDYEGLIRGSRIAGWTANARRVCTDEAQGGTRGDAGANRRSSQQDSLGAGTNGVVAWREPAG